MVSVDSEMIAPLTQHVEIKPDLDPQFFPRPGSLCPGHVTVIVDLNCRYERDFSIVVNSRILALASGWRNPIQA
jgi:hypothetical protein